ncbi:hypothetical protein G9A89_015171 [Geosiphon pyriformis]|nr:hypothetical protein G9A89_015171 [Geosiphon pyriformis]
MGAKISRSAARKFPEKVSNNVKSWVTEGRSFRLHENNFNKFQERIEAGTERQTVNINQGKKPSLVSLSRDQAVEADGKDPDFLRKLSTIGQVNVLPSKTPFQQSDSMRAILKHRKSITEKESEKEDVKDRLTVGELRDLFELRKSAPNEWTAQKLALHFNMDPSTIELLFKYFNTYTIVNSDDGGTIGTWIEDISEIPSPRSPSTVDK